VSGTATAVATRADRHRRRERRRVRRAEHRAVERRQPALVVPVTPRPTPGAKGVVVCDRRDLPPRVRRFRAALLLVALVGAVTATAPPPPPAPGDDRGTTTNAATATAPEARDAAPCTRVGPDPIRRATTVPACAA